ncbi:MAG: HNH endonuclease signature motif containing protein [Pseudomonadota bacterium]
MSNVNPEKENIRLRPLTQERLKSLYSYDDTTGELTRLVRTNYNNAKPGAVAGTTIKHGYKVIKIDYKRFLVHRLVWLYMTGRMPSSHIDHIDGDTGNNRFGNLREASPNINNQNVHRARADNQNGHLGVSRCKNSFQARIFKDGKSHYLGSFKSPELAHEAYLAAKRRMHAGCTI